MNIFGMPVIRLAGAPVCSGLIPSEQLTTWIEQHNKWQSARTKAAKILRKARRERREILKCARQQAALEQEREIIELRALLQQDTQHAINEAVVWLVEEQNFENAIALNLKKKSVSWAVETMRNWGAELDWERLIADRVANLTRQQLGSESVTLYVNSESVESLKQKLPAAIHWRIEADPQLSPRQARLENSLLRISLDLETQFDLLLRQFENSLLSGERVAEVNCGAE